MRRELIEGAAATSPDARQNDEAARGTARPQGDKGVTGGPLFDEAQIAALRDALGEEDLRAMLSELPSAAGQALHKIRTALVSSDLEAARRAAHALKGVASNFGAARLAAIARELELEATSIASISQHILVLADTIDKTLAALPDVERPPSARARR
jgi:histidine phosphotransfer protein HptB